MAKNFDECFYDFLRAIAVDELNVLKRQLQAARGWVDHEVNQLLSKAQRADDWLWNVTQEVDRIEHEIKKNADLYMAMSYVDFVDCLDSAIMGEDMRALVTGFLSKYEDYKYNVINTLSTQTYLEKANNYWRELNSRLTEYIEAIDYIIAEKLSGVF